MRIDRMAVALLAFGALLASGCDDKVGATRGDVDDSLSSHAADASAHHGKTVSASELTEGTLDEARMPASHAAALSDIADHGSRIGDAEQLLDNHAARMLAAEDLLVDHEARVDAAEGTLVDHDTRLDSAETELVAQDGRLDSVESGLASANSSLSGKVSKTGDTMTGTLTVPSIAWSSPKTRSTTIPAVQFVPHDETTTWGTLGYYGHRWMNGGTLTMGAGVSLPEGARITEVSARFYDAHSAAATSVRLVRSHANGYSTLAVVGTTDAEASGWYGKTAALGHTVDYANEGFYHLLWTSTAASSSLRLAAVRITWTESSP